MSEKFTFSIIFFLILNLHNILISQDYSNPRWNQSPSTRTDFFGHYNPLPRVENFVKRDMTTKYYHTNAGNFIVYPNFIPFPTIVTTESEVYATTMTGNQNVMFAGWITSGPSIYSTGFCYSSNGGYVWSGDSQIVVTGGNYGDPSVWIWSSQSPWPGRLGLTVLGSTGISCTYSTNNGITWQPSIGTGGNNNDKVLSCVDDVPGSPFLGRAYTVWTDFGGPYMNRICGAYSSDGGVSWTGYNPISPPPVPGHMCQGCDVCSGPGGIVYVIWANSINLGPGSTEDSLGFAKSTDGGVTWAVSKNNVVDINGIRNPCFLSTCIRVNSFPRIAIDKSGGVRNEYVTELHTV